jgi:predicted AlkP superfamily pyrophosphatase or phosphodiesterase
MRQAAFGIAAVCGLVACGGLVACAPAAPVKPVDGGTKPVPDAPERPRLVVVVVIDQLPSWALQRYLPHLPADGALRQGIARGAYYPEVELGYATTLTGPGHAAIATGAPPSQSGAMSNSVLTPKGKRPAVADGKHPVFGRETATASPTLLRVDTVGDAWRKQTKDSAKVVAVSIKDRAAILSAGRRANLALWFDKRTRRFTTSSYYVSKIPAWLDRWHQAHPLEPLLAPWTASDPALFERVNGPDDQPGELAWMGFGKTFPHTPRESARPYAALCVTPRATELLFALAKTTVQELALGADEVADLLTVSISSTDYAGHTYGPASWEYFDNLLAADRALSQFLAWLQPRQPTAVLVTSDHGAAPLPERNPKGGRIFPEQILEVAEHGAHTVLGDAGKGIQGLGRPFLRLTDVATKPQHRAAVIAAVKKALEAMPAIHRAFDIQALMASKPGVDPIEKLVRASLYPPAPGDLYIVMADGWVVDEGRPRGGGTSHGSPWAYDRTVPVILWGNGVRHVPRGMAVGQSPVPQSRVAPTIAALLGSKPPAHIRVPPLDAVSAP